MVEGDEVDLKAREVRGVVNELMCITVVICTGLVEFWGMQKQWVGVLRVFKAFSF